MISKNKLFLILHVVALLMGAQYLFITIPLHVISNQIGNIYGKYKKL